MPDGINYKITKLKSFEVPAPLNIFQPNGLVKEDYGQLTSKVFTTFAQIHREIEGFDWYLKADDDTFIHVENLKEFLSTKDPKSPVTFGYDFKVIVDQGYHSGIIKKLFLPIFSYIPSMNKFFFSKEEAVMFYRTLRFPCLESN